jgi:hypothetical protein
MECKKRFLDVLAVVKDDKRAVELIGVVFSKIINYATVVYDMETLYYVNNFLLRFLQRKTSINYIPIQSLSPKLSRERHNNYR